MYLVVAWRRQVRDCSYQWLQILQKLLPAASILVVHVVCEVAAVQHRVKWSASASAAWLSAARVCHRRIQRRAPLAVHHAGIAECKELHRAGRWLAGSPEAVSGRPAVVRVAVTSGTNSVVVLRARHQAGAGRSV